MSIPNWLWLFFGLFIVLEVYLNKDVIKEKLGFAYDETKDSYNESKDLVSKWTGLGDKYKENVRMVYNEMADDDMADFDEILGGHKEDEGIDDVEFKELDWNEDE